MFDSLKTRLETVFKALSSHGKLTEEDIDSALREVRRALLEADVNLAVVRTVTANIKQQAQDRQVVASVTPSQLIYTIVYEELIRLMGGDVASLNISSTPPTVFMMVGLQGSGKTTTAVKIAKKMSSSHKPLVVACDLQRPAAVEQLRVLAKNQGVEFFGPSEGQSDPITVAKASFDYAASHLCDMIILDTAGRLQLDEVLMKQVEDMKKATNPHEVLLVVDSMVGQEAVNVARAFHEALNLTGVVLTKLDGDSRGGAALSVREAANVPIKFAGCGEHTEDLELFDAKRMASRIMGMGDMQGLLERVQAATDEAAMDRVADNMLKNRFTMEDMLTQLQQIQRLGPLENILEMLPVPGLSAQMKGAKVDPKALKKTEAIILSMTPRERKNPDIIKGSRRRRIAEGSGTTVQLVNQTIAQYDKMKQMMKHFGKLATKGSKFLNKMPFGKLFK